MTWDYDDDSYDERNKVYYRVLRSLKDGSPTVACMQWFDEFDYDQSRFLTEEQFDTEEAAWHWIYAQIGQAVALLVSLGRS